MSEHLEPRPYTAWQLILAYWKSKERVSAYFFFVVLLFLAGLSVALNVAITTWYNAFYTSLQKYNLPNVIDLMWMFVFIATISVIVSVFHYYLQAYFGLRWRRWLTEEFLTRWLDKRSYYYLENFDRQTDNPDQRIQEDIASLVSYSLDLVLGLFTAIVTIGAFIAILWELSGVIVLPLGALGTFHIPGYLVWVSITYAVIGTVLTYKLGRPLIQLNFEQQRREANFRYGAVDLRIHAENVALYRGEDHQKNVLVGLFDSLLTNWYAIILRQKKLLWFTQSYNQVSVLVPLAVALPNYFNKVFELGGLMQSIAAFDRIQTALSFLVNAFTRLAEWRAISERLITFLNHMADAQKKVLEQDNYVIRYVPQNNIVVKNVCIRTPDGSKLLDNINMEFVHGQNYWISGHSGIGKSTFIRVIAGIWPYGAGEISLPAEKTIMYVPQKSYMPLGTLKQALLFPDNAQVNDAELIQLLKACDLPDLVSQLHSVHKWSEILSPGELQRIAFVRVLLQKPDWVFLDESTAALDMEDEQLLYKLVRKKLANCSIISVGHRASLADYHEHQINLGLNRVAHELV